MQLDEIEDSVRAVLDRRLLQMSDAPVASALSGGGDSLALTLIAAAWARACGRRLLVLTVDHRLQPQSAAWTRRCRETAGRLDARFQALSWDGPKPATGLPAAARHARHALIAEAARAAGARVVLMGHTADDVIEARAMREAGSTTPDPREWAPSPVWPDGRGVFLLRPMLGVRRAALREWLRRRGETWIDDPANGDRASARGRARMTSGEAFDPVLGERPVLELAEACDFDAGGGIHAPRDAVRRAGVAAAQAFVALAAVCAGGGDRRPATDRLRRVAEILVGPSAATATLAGARIQADAAEVSVLREPGDALRDGAPSLYLTEGRPTVWDGRFEILARRSGLHVDRLEGLTRRLPPDQRAALRRLPPKIRAALPVVVDRGRFDCPIVGEAPGVSIRPLVRDRFWAACGLVQREPV